MADYFDKDNMIFITRLNKICEQHPTVTSQLHQHHELITN
jgi:hypothetical protein